MSAMQTIRTKWLGPTNYRGSRIKAISASGHSTVVVSWDYALNIQANHNAAAKALADKMAWPGEWVSGSWGELGGYVYINLSGPRDGFTSGEGEG